MTDAHLPHAQFHPRTLGFSRLRDPALSVAAATLGLVVPVLPLLRRQAWWASGVLGIVWLGALYVFFEHFAGPGFLAHLSLWAVAVAGMAMPQRLQRLEHKLARHVSSIAKSKR